MLFKERKEFSFVSKALPEDAFSVVKFSGTESISRPFEFDITLSSGDPEIDLKTVLQNPATLTVTHGDEELSFHGVLARFEQLHEVKQHAFYRAVLVSKLWNAGLYRENQIFLDKTVPQVIEETLKQAGMAGNEYELHLTRSYPGWEHICQYQETDFDFISRWMEREGIYYFFEQSEEGAKIVISDNLSIHKEIQGDPAIAYSPPSGLIPSEKEIIREFACRQRMLPSRVILKDYNYRKPGLEVKAEAEVDPKGRGEVYIYEEHFKDPDQGKELAKIRAEELLCREVEFHGEGTDPAFSPGFLFELTGHYRSDYNRKYLIVEVTHEGSRSEDLLAGLGDGKSAREEEAGYFNRFVCIPADVQFRPERRTPKPKFYGTINAFVDAAGDGKYAELDDQGRYKVILPFDLSGRKDGKASRFIRMAQPYSGFTSSDGMKRPSGMHFPLHKGAEVLLTFVDGDPDRPIISSAVPNPETTSPVVSVNQTQSVIRDNYGNELIFDSTPGDEHIRLHSPHHSSGIELGRSMRKWTKSDESELKLGNSIDIVYGNAVDLKLGSMLDAKVGLAWNVLIGLTTDISLGGRLTFNAEYDLKSNRGPIVDTTSADILSAAGKDHILTAGDQVCIIGGDSSRKDSFLTLKKNRRPQEVRNNRSIVNVFPEKLILSVGKKDNTRKINNERRTWEGKLIKDEIYGKNPPKWALIPAAILPALAGMGSTGYSAVTGLFKDLSEAYGSEKNEGSTSGDNNSFSVNDLWNATDGAVGAISGIVLAIAYRLFFNRYIGDNAIEPVGHQDPSAKIELVHEGKVLVNSKEESVVIRVGANNDENMKGAGLRLDKDAVLLGRKEKLDTQYSDEGSQLWMSRGGGVGLIAEKHLILRAKNGSVKIKSNEFFGPRGNLKILSN